MSGRLNNWEATTMSDRGDKPDTDDHRKNPEAGLAPIAIVRALLLLLLCQLAGEALVTGLRLLAPAIAFPGPVVGMLLFFVFLAIRGRIGAAIDAVGRGILGNLSLLFVPAAVGVIQYGDVLASAGLTLVLALLVSTAATLIVTVYTFVFVSRFLGGSSENGTAR
jgi:holin-like protein